MLSRSNEEAGRLEPKSTTQRQSNYNDVQVYSVNQINRDEAGNVVVDRQDQETGTRDRRTRIQRDEAGNVVGNRQDRATGTGDWRTRVQRDKAGNVVGDRRIAGETCMNKTAKTIWHQVNSVQLIYSPH